MPRTKSKGAAKTKVSFKSKKDGQSFTLFATRYKLRQRAPIILTVIGVALLGLHLLYPGIAATFATSKEAENGAIAGNAATKNGTNASNGQFVKFGGTTACTPNAILVNPCRVLIGAVAKGNPGTPTEIANGTAPATDVTSQFNYLEGLIGNHLDIFRTYHNGTGDYPFDPSTAVGKAEIHFANRADTYVDINWEPSDWPHSSGGDASVNKTIDQTAANIKAVAPHKVFVSLWHEANLHVSAKDNANQNCSHLNTASPDGTPDQYIAAWQNIQKRFTSDGVTNAIWLWGLGSDPADTCWVPYMWPGNSNVDWITYDTYGRASRQTWAETGGVFYTWLQNNSTPANNFKSKPWGIGEFGDADAPTQQDAYSYFKEITADIQSNTYPNLKMFQIFASTGGPNSGSGSLTDYDTDGTYDKQKQQDINAMFNTMLSQ